MVFRHTAEVFGGEEPVSCRRRRAQPCCFTGPGLPFEEEARPRAAAWKHGSRAWELCDFIVNGLGVNKLPGRLERRVAFHRTCIRA
jgi:L-lactate dehydrogenase complex protein LldE